MAALPADSPSRAVPALKESAAAVVVGVGVIPSKSNSFACSNASLP